jgi:hypothetical protein
VGERFSGTLVCVQLESDSFGNDFVLPISLLSNYYLLFLVLVIFVTTIIIIIIIIIKVNVKVKLSP